MKYETAVSNEIDYLRKFLLGKISYKNWKSKYKGKENSYDVVFSSNNLNEFAELMLSFFDNERLVFERLLHEKKHDEINKRYNLSSTFLLKAYFRAGKTRYRPSVKLNSRGDIMKSWSKEKIWSYYFDQTSMEDASDNDKQMNQMLIEIKKDIGKTNIS